MDLSQQPHKYPSAQKCQREPGSPSLVSLQKNGQCVKIYTCYTMSLTHNAYLSSLPALSLSLSSHWEQSLAVHSLQRTNKQLPVSRLASFLH